MHVCFCSRGMLLWKFTEWRTILMSSYFFLTLSLIWMYYLLSLCPIRCLSPTLCLLSSLPLILTVFHFSLISSFGSPTAAAGKVLCLAQSFSSSFPSALSVFVLQITLSFSIHSSLITAETCTFHHEITPLQTHINLILTYIMCRLDHSAATRH